MANSMWNGLDIPKAFSIAKEATGCQCKLAINFLSIHVNANTNHIFASAIRAWSWLRIERFLGSDKCKPLKRIFCMLMGDVTFSIKLANNTLDLSVRNVVA